MNIDIIPLVLSLIPSLIIALLAFYFFNLHTQNEEKRRRFLLHKESQKLSLPTRFQAYERMALFLERISPGKLLLRTTPPNDDKKVYEALLVNTIEQEFDHNLAQQIYISDECWNIIKAAKNATIGLIRSTNLKKDVVTADDARETILSTVIEQGAPSDAALSFIKNEVSNIF